MSILRINRPPVKPARRTARPAAPFGDRVFAPRGGRQPFTAADLRWAAQAFAADDEPDYDQMAGEAAYLASLESLEPPVGHCRSCGQPAETNENGWCQGCDAMADEIGVASTNLRFGLGNRAS